MATGATCTFYDCQQEVGDGLSGLCDEHRNKEWYTVAEAAGIWNASERSVRDWITRRGIVAAERSGRRPYLISATEFSKAHPTQRARPTEPEPMVTILPGKWYRWLTNPLSLGVILTLILATALGALTLTGHLSFAPWSEESPKLRSPGVFVGETPLSVMFDRWEPDEPVLAMVGQETELQVAFTNTSPVAGDFYAAVSLRNPQGEWVDLRPLKRVQLEPGAQGKASWQYAPALVGTWDLVFGIWGFWEEGQEPKEPVGNTGILQGRIEAFQQCIESPITAGSVRIDRYTPFNPIQLTTGADAELSITFANTSDEARSFSAGATVWRVGQSDDVDGEYRSTTGNALQPGEVVTMSWHHQLDTQGSYQLMFTIWDAEDRFLLRAPCPRQPMFVVNSPLSPQLAGIDPNQPRSKPDRQWISIHGDNFTETSIVVLSIQGNRYPIAEERTQFVSPEQLRVLVGLTDPGTWTAQVVNVGDVRSNLFEFRVLP